MRRSSIIMLIAAVALGLVAVLFARTFLGGGGSAAGPGKIALRTVPTVVAAADINFGEKLTPAKLKLVDWPADNVPVGSFQRIEELTSGDGRTAMRPIVANEILTQKSLATGANRLSTAPMLTPQMRAIAVPVNEVAGVAGLIYPGDRVDVFFTRQPEEAMPYGELIAQGLRVLAAGEDMNVGKDKAELTKTVTLEVNALQGQKISLALATGQLSLALRHFSDNERIRLQTVQVMDLNDGTTTRLVRKPRDGGGSPPPAAATQTARPGADGPAVIVMRGTEASLQPVLAR